jgi:hypothetical protein
LRLAGGSDDEDTARAAIRALHAFANCEQFCACIADDAELSDLLLLNASTSLQRLAILRLLSRCVAYASDDFLACLRASLSLFMSNMFEALLPLHRVLQSRAASNAVSRAKDSCISHLDLVALVRPCPVEAPASPRVSAVAGQLVDVMVRLHPATMQLKRYPWKC